MMSTYYVVEPEVAGGLGPHTVMQRDVHPPRVSWLHYDFDGWLGDEILETFPCFIVTKSLAASFEQAGLTGIEFSDVEITASEQFHETNRQGRTLPSFLWLKIIGVAGKDDFGIGPKFRLVVSKKALLIIEATHPRGMTVEAFG